jgi:peptidoglycan/LPS O-acetylase OafA/YrhL
MVLGALFLRKQSLQPASTTNDWITAAGILACCALIGAGVGDTLISLAAVGCFSWAIYRLADGRGWLTDLLSSRAMLLLGGASYTVYLLQSLVREITRRALVRFHPGLDAALSPIILVFLSCLIFLFYEEPLRDVVRKLLLRRTASSKVAA